MTSSSPSSFFRFSTGPEFPALHFHLPLLDSQKFSQFFLNLIPEYPSFHKLPARITLLIPFLGGFQSAIPAQRLLILCWDLTIFIESSSRFCKVFCKPPLSLTGNKSFSKQKAAYLPNPCMYFNSFVSVSFKLSHITRLAYFVISTI